MKVELGPELIFSGAKGRRFRVYPDADSAVDRAIYEQGLALERPVRSQAINTPASLKSDPSPRG